MKKNFQHSARASAYTHLSQCRLRSGVGLSRMIGFMLVAFGLLPFLGRTVHAQESSGTYGSLLVTGTASANELDVSGILDVQDNTIQFGSSSVEGADYLIRGGALIYFDGTDGVGATATSLLSCAGSTWIWDRQPDANAAMELNPSNQLILTGTQSSNPGSIVIDPNAGQVSINGTPLPTMSEIASEFMPLNPGSFTASTAGFTTVSVEGSQAYVGINASGAEAALDFEANGSDSGDKSFRVIDRADEFSIDKMNDACTNVAIGGIAQFLSNGDVAIGAGGITFQTEGASGQATLGNFVFASYAVEIGSQNDGWESDYVGGYPSSATRGGQIRLGGGLRGDQAVNGILFMQNGTEVGRFNNGGNFGVGSASPESVVTVEKDVSGGRGGELSVVNMGGGAGAEAAINFGVDNTTYNANNSNAQIKAVNVNQTGENDSALVVSTWNGSSFGERLRVAPSGALGLGTTTPQSQLDVNGSTYMRGTVIVPGVMVGGTGTVVASGTNLVLIPQQGDLSMGPFTAGATPQ